MGFQRTFTFADGVSITIQGSSIQKSSIKVQIKQAKQAYRETYNREPLEIVKYDELEEVENR